MSVLANKRVMIVEDATDIQLVLQSVLKDAGYAVTCSSNGADALTALAATEELPGVILLDLMMPKMDGYEFRKAQGADKRIAKIPVVVMTADGRIPDKSKSLGAHAWLKKPFVDIELILETIERFFPKESA